MCGRYSQRPLDDLQIRFNARRADVHFRPRYNIVPTQPVDSEYQSSGVTRETWGVLLGQAGSPIAAEFYSVLWGSYTDVDSRTGQVARQGNNTV